MARVRKPSARRIVGLERSLPELTCEACDVRKSRVGPLLFLREDDLAPDLVTADELFRLYLPKA